MSTHFTTSDASLHNAGYLCATVALALTCSIGPSQAYAITAAEKQAEADAVYAQIDSLQTNLNAVMDEYDRAQQAYERACTKRDEAGSRAQVEAARIEELQADLSSFAVGMYKQGGAKTFLDVLFDSTSFEQFLTSWDACNLVFRQGEEKLSKTQKARVSYEAAQAEYEEQGKRAEDEMIAAQQAQAEIEETREALREEAEKLSAEAAELQREEELAAEAARQAEEARKRREAELAAAAKAAEEQAAQQAAAEAEAARAAQEAQEAAEAASDSEVGEIAVEEATPEAAEASAPIVGPGFFTNPCPTASNSSGFGYREFDNSFHKGLDMAAPEGTPYYAAESGTVMYATNDGGYNGGAGNWVVIAHGNGIVTKYMHSQATFVQPGDYVERGQNIGTVGNTGQSFGAHLHFQVEIGGVAVNPLTYL